jgi:hypothetical protein
MSRLLLRSAHNIWHVIRYFPYSRSYIASCKKIPSLLHVELIHFRIKTRISACNKMRCSVDIHKFTLHGTLCHEKQKELSRELDIEDWQLSPKIFSLLHDRWGPHSIDRFASMLNTQLPCFNAKWQGLDPDPTAPRIPETTRVRTRSRGSGP